MKVLEGLKEARAALAALAPPAGSPTPEAPRPERPSRRVPTVGDQVEMRFAGKWILGDVFETNTAGFLFKTGQGVNLPYGEHGTTWRWPDRGDETCTEEDLKAWPLQVTPERVRHLIRVERAARKLLQNITYGTAGEGRADLVENLRTALVQR